MCSAGAAAYLYPTGVPECDFISCVQRYFVTRCVTHVPRLLRFKLAMATKYLWLTSLVPAVRCARRTQRGRCDRRPAMCQAHTITPTAVRESRPSFTAWSERTWAQSYESGVDTSGLRATWEDKDIGTTVKEASQSRRKMICTDLRSLFNHSLRYAKRAVVHRCCSLPIQSVSPQSATDLYAQARDSLRQVLCDHISAWYHCLLSCFCCVCRRVRAGWCIRDVVGGTGEGADGR